METRTLAREDDTTRTYTAYNGSVVITEPKPQTPECDHCRYPYFGELPCPVCTPETSPSDAILASYHDAMKTYYAILDGEMPGDVVDALTLADSIFEDYDRALQAEFEA